jgi:MFS family permease
MKRISRLFNRSYRGYCQTEGTLRQLDIILVSAAFGNVLFANTTGAALTGYAAALGAGEFLFGVISALPVLASLVQLFASYMVEKTGDRRLLLLCGGLAQRALWVVAAFIPYFIPPAAQGLRVYALLALVTMASASSSFVNVSHMSMVAEVVPMHIRGRYLTTRQRVITLFAMGGGLGGAFVLDHVAGMLGFAIVFGVGGLFGLADILMYWNFDFPPMRRAEHRITLAEGFRACFGTPKTRDFLIFWGAWTFAINLSSQFFNLYAIEVLGLPFTTIVLFGQIMSNVAAILVVQRWGRFTDRYGCAPLLMITCTVTGLLCLVWLPARPGGVLPLLLFNLLGGFFWCGTDTSALGMQLSHTPDIGRPLSLAIYAVVTNVSGAVAFLVGGAFLQWAKPLFADPGIRFAGAHFDHYKLLFAITAFARVLVAFALLPRVWNEKGYAPLAVYREVLSRARRRALVTYAWLRHHVSQKTLWQHILHKTPLNRSARHARRRRALLRH